MPDHTHNTVPIEIARYVVSNNLEKAFAIYLYLKNSCSGVISDKDVSILLMGKHIGIKDQRTVKKHFQKLIKLNWVGHNKKSGNYFIRGFRMVKAIENLKSRHGIIISNGNLNEVKYQLFAGLIGFRINGLKRYQYRKIKKQVGSSALKKYGALQMAKQLGLRDYFGLSNTQIGELLGCSKSTANRLKIKCANLQYLKVTKKYKFIVGLEKADMYISRFTPQSNKLIFRRNKEGYIKVFEQLTDEIVSNVNVKRMHY